VFAAGSGGDYRRTTSKTNDWATRMLRTARVRILATLVLRYFSHRLENSCSNRHQNQGASAREITRLVESKRTSKCNFKLFSSVLLVEREV
jgi:hypothetical protein